MQPFTINLQSDQQKPSTMSHFKKSTIQTNLLWWALMQYRLWIHSLALWQKLQRTYSVDKWRDGKKEEEEGVRDIDRYREQRKESRCGLWAETAESPRLLSLLYRIVNLEHFLWSKHRVPVVIKGRERQQRGKTEEKPTKEEQTNRKERKHPEEVIKGRSPNILPPPLFILPSVLISPWEALEDTVSFVIHLTGLGLLHKD